MDNNNATTEPSTEEKTITVVDYIAEQERLEKEAKELFPKKFDACTFNLGYIRQAVYACMTCNPTDPAGFCYSCSISCHGDHQLVELFTKRRFRCDCGTEKFKTVKCSLDPKLVVDEEEEEASKGKKPIERVAKNDLNKYNHNYVGRFCWCDILYDPEKEESTMLQCVVCEDWFHDHCVGINPHNDDFDDFICRTCTKAHPFLRRYANHPLFMVALSAKGSSDPKATIMVDCSKKPQEVDTKATTGASTTVQDENMPVDVVNDSTTTTPTATDVSGQDVGTKRPLESEEEVVVKKAKTELETSTEVSSDANAFSISTATTTITSSTSTTTAVPVDTTNEVCRLDQQPPDAYPDQEMSLFVNEGWRDLLCECSKCLHLYNHVEKVPFILGEEEVYENEDDDDGAEEEEGAESNGASHHRGVGTSLLENGMKELEQMDRVKALEGLIAYNTLRDEVRSFLAPFSESKKVVTAEDIQRFFEAKMEARAANRKL